MSELYRINEVPDPTGQLADLLSELFDNSALVKADPDYEAAINYAVRFFLGDRAAKRPIPTHIQSGVKNIVNAALGIDDREET